MYVFFGFTSGDGTFIGSLIERAGANNAAADAGIQGYQQVNEEVLVSANPDWVVFNTDDPGIPEGAGYQSTTAAQENQTVTVNTNHLNRPAPRVVYAVGTMADAFHGDAYEGAQAPEDTSASGPGFGVASALAALAVVGLLFRRL
jgi:iron complex transport system substrate-binding protein